MIPFRALPQCIPSWTDTLLHVYTTDRHATQQNSFHGPCSTTLRKLFGSTGLYFPRAVIWYNGSRQCYLCADCSCYTSEISCQPESRHQRGWLKRSPISVCFCMRIFRRPFKRVQACLSACTGARMVSYERKHASVNQFVEPPCTSFITVIAI